MKSCPSISPLPFQPPFPRAPVTLAQHVADRNDPHGTLDLARRLGFVTREDLAALVDGAPETLDTLREIAERLGSEGDVLARIVEDVRILKLRPAPVQPDWSEGDPESGAFIRNRPALAAVATSGRYDDLTGRPTIPAPVTTDSVLSTTSENPVQNKVVKAAIDARPTKAQIDAGWWSEWTFSGTAPQTGWSVVWISDNIGWDLYDGDDSVTVNYTAFPSDDQDGSERIVFDNGVTAVRHRVAAPVPTKTSDLTNDSGFLTQHQQLTPVYRDGYENDRWTVTPPTIDGVALVVSRLSDMPSYWSVFKETTATKDSTSALAQPIYAEDPDKIEWSAEDMDAYSGGNVTYAISVTRTRAVIVGYTLGDQTTKPLQPQGDYYQKPSGGIPKTDLASAVQASLGLADTAVQPAGIAGLLPMYALGSTPTVAQTASVISSLFPITGEAYYLEAPFTLQESDANYRVRSVSGRYGLEIHDDNYDEWYYLCYFNTDGTFDDIAEDVASIAFNGDTPTAGETQVLDIKNILTVSPYTVATYTADSTAAAFEIAVGAFPTGVTGKARDCILVIDCTATGAVAPTVTWDTHFHPRTDTATDLAIVEAGKRAVFYISEYASGEFAVGGWQETEGGYAPNGGSGT